MKRCLPLAALVGCVTVLTAFGQQSAIAPKFLLEKESQLKVDNGDVEFKLENGALDIVIKETNKSGYPGVELTPATGKTWDLSPWGHVEVKITNTGKTKAGFNVRIDDDSDWKLNPWNAEPCWLDPGKSKVQKVIFGYSYGNKGYALKSDRVKRLLLFSNKAGAEQSFRLEDIQAAGAAGETPPVDPNSVRIKPVNGVMYSAAKPSPDVVVDASKPGVLAVKPKVGSWNLMDAHNVKVKIRNPGKTAVPATFAVKSGGSSTDAVKADLKPGAEQTVSITFVPKAYWEGVEKLSGTYNGAKPGTGSTFDNVKVTSVAVTGTGAEGLEIREVLADATPVQLPAWVGKRPPVDGKWKMTLDENFDKPIDLNLWNIYAPNYWDKRTHFSKDNLIVKDGKAILHYEKKRGWHNDEEGNTSNVAETDYACGILTTMGKWTQRYGYFEARMKMPRCGGLWPAFWTMPDRGKDKDPTGEKWWLRTDTNKIGNDQIGGMEFDIMEHLTGWGPYRFNSAFHWGGYGKDHKSVGTSNMYVPTDKEGFFTIGFLWEPGYAAFYGNGEMIGSWKNERVTDTPAYLILYMVSGGWANVPLETDKLPVDFVIDYVRVWQRADLASPTDGPQKNNGNPHEMKN